MTLEEIAKLTNVSGGVLRTTQIVCRR